MLAVALAALGVTFGAEPVPDASAPDSGVGPLDGGRPSPPEFVALSGTVRRRSGDHLGLVVVKASRVHGGVVPAGEFGLFPQFHVEAARDGAFTFPALPVDDLAFQATDGAFHSAIVVLRAEELGTHRLVLEVDDSAPHLGPDDQPGTE